MKQKSILFPCLLLAASVYAWLESGQAELFSGQDQWPVLLMLLGAAFVYQGKKKPLHPIFLSVCFSSGSVYTFLPSRNGYGGRMTLKCSSL